MGLLIWFDLLHDLDLEFVFTKSDLTNEISL
jgi:hypothetical protein